MRILQIQEPGRAVWIETEVPTPGDQEVLIKVTGVTTCPHWDMHILGGKPMFPGMKLEYPYLLGQPGHEAVGEVVEIGAEVRNLKVGDRVAAWRDTGKPRQGFYAQYNTFHEDDLLKVPRYLKDEEIASLELAMCVEVSFQQLDMLGGIKGRRIGIAGLGPAGLLGVQMARAHGAATVVGIDPMSERRDLAFELGAHLVLNPDDDDWPASRSDGALDDAIDMTGLPVSIEYLMERTRRAVALFGVLREEVRFTSRQMFGPGLILMGYADHNKKAAETALQMIIDGSLKLAPLVTQKMSFRDYADGVQLLRNKKAIKILFDPWA
jgi:2-desacetyl-2-hydroxyethyl bacteriochlorophyllide A dehydrogenase